MADKIKEFRLVHYLNSKRASGFLGAKSAASPLAYYYHLKKNKKVILGGHIYFRGLGPYKSYIKDYFEENESVEIPLRIKCGNKKSIIISNIGYIYQDNDPLFSYIKDGIYWQCEIKKICMKKMFSRKERNDYYLKSYQIGMNEDYAIEEYEEDSKEHWKILVSDLKMIKNPINYENKNRKFLSTYIKEDYPDVCNFYNLDGNRFHLYNNAFVHVCKNHYWTDFDKKLNYFNQNEMSPVEIINSQIQNCRIRESLIHEMLRILLAKEGWYVNFEIPIRFRKKQRRIDFLIKRNSGENEPWFVIEVKLRDNPSAVSQLDSYLNIIEKIAKNSNSLYLMFDGKNNKKVKGVILTAKSDNLETKNEVENCKKDFLVWTYDYYFINTNNNIRLGVKICDEKGNQIIGLKSHDRN